MFIWTISDVINIAAIALYVIFAVVLLVWIGFRQWRRQRRCQHSRVHETQACDAICAGCGKNLGFIGTWREQQKNGGA